MDELEQIKSKIDIVSFLSEYLPLKKAGRNFKAICPFHLEKTPSFVVSPERQIWHCFGACQEGGDIFRFLMKSENMEFVEALQVLSKRAGVTLSRYQPTETSRLRQKLYEINHLAAEYYCYLLENHPAAKACRQYLEKRQVVPSSRKLFGLGYAPTGWDNLTRFLTKKKGYALSDLDTAGLIIRNRDRFFDRLMFALRDHRGNVVGFAGRSLNPEAKEDKYINTAETSVYRKGDLLYGLDITRDAIRKEDGAVIVEGEIDAIQSYQAGVAHVVAIKGSSLTEAQVRLLGRYTKNVVLALDADFAGDSAARRGLEIADAAGMNLKVCLPKYGKDPDECAKHSPSLWRESVKEAVPLYDFIINSAAKRHGLQTAEAKKAVSEEVFPWLSKITNVIVKTHYLKKLCRLFDVGEETILEALSVFERHQGGFVTKRETTTIAALKPETAEEYLLSLLLQTLPNDLLPIAKKFIGPGDFADSAIGQVFEKLIACPKKNFEINEFAAGLPLELISVVDRLFLSDKGAFLKDEGHLEKEIIKVGREIKKLSVKRKLVSLAEEIKMADESSLALLNQRFRALSQALTALGRQE